MLLVTFKGLPSRNINFSLINLFYFFGCGFPKRNPDFGFGQDIKKTENCYRSKDMCKYMHTYTYAEMCKYTYIEMCQYILIYRNIQTYICAYVHIKLSAYTYIQLFSIPLPSLSSLKPILKLILTIWDSMCSVHSTYTLLSYPVFHHPIFTLSSNTLMIFITHSSLVYIIIVDLVIII